MNVDERNGRGPRPAEEKSKEHGRRPYSSPQLTLYGTVRELTSSDKTHSLFDGSSGMTMLE